tara:strand:- start:3473 stop:3760 length:288 start_codon:yes stop_codon:yes gene_type:complete
MKKFLVFAGVDYSPAGGIRDLIGTTDDIESAVRLSDEEDLINGEDLKYDWAHIFNVETGETECYRFNDGKWGKNDVWFPNLATLEKENAKLLGEI